MNVGGVWGGAAPGMIGPLKGRSDASRAAPAMKIIPGLSVTRVDTQTTARCAHDTPKTMPEMKEKQA